MIKHFSILMPFKTCSFSKVFEPLSILNSCKVPSRKRMHNEPVIAFMANDTIPFHEI